MGGYRRNAWVVIAEIRNFGQVRGEFESNSFVQAVLDHIEKKEALGNELLSRLRE